MEGRNSRVHACRAGQISQRGTLRTVGDIFSNYLFYIKELRVRYN